MSEPHPVVERYLTRLTGHLSGLSPADRDEIVRDIRSHVAESVAAGRSLDQAIQALGPADELARAYGVEFLVNPRGTARTGSGASRFLRIAALVVIGSIPTLVIVVVLSTVGVSFIASGLAVLTAGIVGAVGELPTWLTMDVPPVFAILLGPVMAAVGVLAIVGLVFYIKFVAFTVRAVLPRG